jgi:hypothetical protein
MRDNVIGHLLSVAEQLSPSARDGNRRRIGRISGAARVAWTGVHH